MAANISVIPLPEVEVEPEEAGYRLSSLSLGQQGEVLHISKASRGSERRRFLDLGILPGTVIKAEMASPSGDPTAYRIREALIALRQEQADQIRIKKIQPGDQGLCVEDKKNPAKKADKTDAQKDAEQAERPC